MSTNIYASLFLHSEPIQAIRASLARRAAARVRRGTAAGIRQVYAEIGLPALVKYFRPFKRHDAERVARAVLGLMPDDHARCETTTEQEVKEDRQILRKSARIADFRTGKMDFPELAQQTIYPCFTYLFFTSLYERCND